MREDDPHRAETILVIEDEAQLRALLKSLLERRGYRVLEARDGLEGVQIYRQHAETISLLLVDQGLPKLSGWEAFLQIREITPTAKAIFMSGDPHLGSELIQKGMRDFVPKPFMPAEILNLIREVISRQA